MTAGEVSNTSPRLSETKDSNPYAYTLEILTITNNEGISMDVRNMMGECKIFEAITNNFLMGELIIIDSITPPLFKQLLFTGQESLRIKFRMGGDEGNPHNFPSIDKLFRIYKVSNFQRHDQTTIAYKLSFCSPEFLTSRRFRVSKVYRGSHIEVAGKIGQEYLSFQEPPDPIETKVSVEEAEDRVFETETYSAKVTLGNVQFSLRCGTLPQLLGMTLMMGGTQGILGNDIFRDRKIGYFPRRGLLVI